MTDPNFLWWRDGVIYHLYLRSFADSNGDGVGDLPGLLAHLDYLSDLGIDAIWLSPMFPSPGVDYGYDISDYQAIDPRFGTMDDFEHLVKQCHTRGIRIILDMVLNHTSDQHPWFQSARSARDNPFHDWYLWRDPQPGKKYPNNWESVVGGKAWEFVPGIGQFYYHAYFRQQPDLNWRNPQVRKAMLDIFRFWLERDVDGFRLDVFNCYFKHPDFPDNPPKIGLRSFDRQQHLYERDQPEMLPFLSELRQLLDSYLDRYAVGEPIDSDARLSGFYCGKDRLHQVFNFDFMKAGWNARKYLDLIKRWEAALPADAWPCFVFSNHDVARLASRLRKGEDDARAKVAAALLLTLRGTPYIYYGEEIGMRNTSLRHDQILDPVGRRYWPLYKGRDGSRSPMQWDASTQAGFSTTKPWIHIHPDYLHRNILVQRANPSSLFNVFRSLLSLRRSVPALTHGNFTPLETQTQQMLAFLRQEGDQIVLVILNFSKRPELFDLPLESKQRSWTLIYSTGREQFEVGENCRLMLGSYEVLILLSE